MRNYRSYKCPRCGKHVKKPLGHCQDEHPEIKIMWEHSRYFCMENGCEFSSRDPVEAIRHYIIDHLKEKPFCRRSPKPPVRPTVFKSAKSRIRSNKGIPLVERAHRLIDKGVDIEKTIGRAVIDLMNQQQQIIKDLREKLCILEKELAGLKESTEQVAVERVESTESTKRRIQGALGC